jgi:thiosulfate/3-mercaptopyruvate sulfurtransferase
VNAGAAAPGSGDPVASTPGDAVASTPAVTVSTEWLAAHLGDPDLRVADVRGKVLPPGSKPRYLAKRVDYDAAHIPGAVFIDWTRDIVDPADPVPMQIAQPGPFAAKMAELGIGARTLVVAYDDYDHIFAGRFAWALRYYGHDRVRVLDGGWARWVAESRAVDAKASPAVDAKASPVVDAKASPVADAAPNLSAPSEAFVATARPALRRTADEVARSLGRPDVLLIDARPAEQYAGAVSAATRSGHIPGAFNVPYARLVDPATGRFLEARALARAFQESGVDVAALPREVVVYCNGGVSCTVPLNALRLLGRDDVAVYDGSWNEWGEDASRPIKAGEKP